MAIKLYPPILGGAIPAFYGTVLKVPFTMNKIVSIDSIDGFELLVKTVSTGKLLGRLTIMSTEDLNGNKTFLHWDKGNNILTFNVSENANIQRALNIGQYYKIQLAYINKGAIGYYSTVATVKYTGEPTIFIENLSALDINTTQASFVGCYTNFADSTERVYSYEFNVYNKQGELYDSSGELLHNSSEDESMYEFRDMFTLNKDLPLNEIYYIQYKVTTLNKMIVSSAKYQLMQRDTIEPDIQVDVKAVADTENACIKVSLKSKPNNEGYEAAATGSFYLKRASNKDNYGAWHTVYHFQLNGQLPSLWSWQDYTIEHGYKYKYALQQHSNTLLSNRLESNEVCAIFDNAYLFDGTRQLTLKFNPKISSFKTTQMESKQDTIGGKYPTFFKNGNVAYKEFPISGLISYHADDQELFISKEELLLEFKNSNLTDENIMAERIFKMKVLDWLNNGQPKIFKSPAEGNFIVRLMNVSLSPNDTLGRMLHTFSATAYEVGPYDYNTIVEKGFLHIDSLLGNMVTRWETFNVFDQDNGVMNYTPNTALPLHYPLTSVILSDMIPGTQFAIALEGEAECGNPITIGATGMYKIDLEDHTPIVALKLVSNQLTSGSITYSYNSSSQNVFDTIQDVEINDWQFRQFIGHHNNIIGTIEDCITYTNDQNIEVTFQGLRERLLGIKYLRFFKRPVYTLYSRGEKEKWPPNYPIYYWDEECTNAITLNRLDASCIYLLYSFNEDNMVDINSAKYMDGQNGNIITDYSNTLIINGESYIDLTNSENFVIPDGCDIKTLTMGSGLICDCAYQTKTIVYNLEDEDTIIQQLKQKMINAEKNFYRFLWGTKLPDDPPISDYVWDEDIVTSEYLHEEYMAKKTAFLIALYEALETQKGE